MPIFLASGFTLVVLAAVGAILLAREASRGQDWVSHTLEVRTQVLLMQSELEGAESSQRGYIITNNEAFLSSLTATLVSIRKTFDALRGLTADNSIQQQRLSSLLPIIDSKIDELQSTITLNRNGHHDQAVAIVEGGRGKELMDQIRSGLDEFSKTELSLLIQREDDAARLRNYVLAAMGLGLLGVLILAFLVIRMVRQYIDLLNERTEALRIEAQQRQEAEDILRQAYKMDAIGQLAGGIAHDFNNFLTIIKGNLDTALRRLASDDFDKAKMANVLERAAEGANKAAKVTHRILAFARKQPLEPAPLNLNALITGISQMLLRTVGEKVTIETVLAGGLWPTLADQNQLETALVNLVLNARDAMPDGGKITIETANTYLDEAYASRFGDVTPGQYVQFSVSDNGMGMSSETLRRVFEPFFTTKQTGAGSGLGLAMVHGFVKQSGGHIRVYSEPGQGATVKIYLPRLLDGKEPAANPRPHDTSEPDKNAYAAKPGETVLVVEDETEVREYAASALQELGYEVRTAQDADEAHRILNDGNRIDLLFTDVVLPTSNGRDLARWAIEKRPNLPVLFTTGYSRNAIVHQGRLDADVQLVNKPYTKKELGLKIRSLLDRS